MASGNTLCVFGPYDAVLPSTNYPQFAVRTVPHIVLAFDTTTQETAYFETIMPQSYSNATGVTVYINQAAASATSGTLGFGVSFERDTDGALDIDGDGFASEILFTPGTVAGTAGIMTTISQAFTAGAQMDSVVKGDHFRIRVRRDVANDTASGDGHILSIEIRET